MNRFYRTNNTLTIKRNVTHVNTERSTQGEGKLRWLQKPEQPESKYFWAPRECRCTFTLEENCWHVGSVDPRSAAARVYSPQILETLHNSDAILRLI